MLNKTEIDHLLLLVNERMHALSQKKDSELFGSAVLEYGQLIDLEQQLHSMLEKTSQKLVNIQ